jgi:NlpC/P60 family
MAPPAIQDERARILARPILRQWGLTVREYQTQWLGLYRQISGGALPIDGCNLPGGSGILGIGSEIPANIAPVVAYAYAQLNKPYVWGGAGPDGFDCSGLTLRAYQTISINLPHSAATQAQYGRAVDWRSEPIQPGDLIFHRGSIPIHDNGHVGIAINATQWIIAPKTGDVISLRPIPFNKIQTVRRLASN